MHQRSAEPQLGSLADGVREQSDLGDAAAPSTMARKEPCGERPLASEPAGSRNDLEAVALLPGPVQDYAHLQPPHRASRHPRRCRPAGRCLTWRWPCMLTASWPQLRHARHQARPSRQACRPHGRGPQPPNDPRRRSMHPHIIQQFAGEHVKELLAEADDPRRARQTRRSRRPRESWQRTPRRRAGLEHPSVAIAITTAPAAEMVDPPAESDQGREPAVADRGHARAGRKPPAAGHVATPPSWRGSGSRGPPAPGRRPAPQRRPGSGHHGGN